VGWDMCIKERNWDTIYLRIFEFEIHNVGGGLSSENHLLGKKKRTGTIE